MSHRRGCHCGGMGLAQHCGGFLLRQKKLHGKKRRMNDARGTGVVQGRWERPGVGFGIVCAMFAARTPVSWRAFTVETAQELR